MRYWVYKDAQIMGPLERDQLAESVGLRADTLVCGEDASGGREGDWRCAEEIPELSGHYHSTRGVPGADMPFEEFSLLERLQFEAVGGDPENSWLGSLFEPPGAEPPRPQSSGLLAELKSSQDRVRELTDQLAGLQRKLEGLEAAGRQPKAPPAPTPFSAVAAPPPPAKEPPPAAFKLPDLPPMPTFTPRATEAPPPALPEAPAPEAAAPPAAEVPPEPEAPPEDDNPNRLKLSTPVKKTLQLGPAKTFKSAKKTEPPAAAIPPAPLSAPPPAFAPLEAPPQLPTLSPPPPMPVLEPPPLPAAAPPPMPTLAPPPAPLPTPTAPPPATLVFSTPSSQPTPGLEPPPIPSLGGAATRPFLPPDTNPPAAPPATIPPSAAKGAPNTKEVLARLAKPQAGAAGPTKPPAAKPRSQKTFFIVAGVGVAALAVIGWFILFRNPKEIKSAVSMEPETQAAEQQEAPQAPPPQPEPAPAPAPAPPPQPEPAPAPAAEDPRAKAIELVRTYPLDGDRGTVGQWLQSAYSASQGNAEKWDAGAVEESVYLVQYTVQSSGQKLREAITYIFEADISKGLVRAKSPLARTLMAGGNPAAPKKAVKRKPRAAARRAEAPAAAPKALPQLPLPSDAELLPPSEDDGSFSGDTVQPGL